MTKSAQDILNDAFNPTSKGLNADGRAAIAAGLTTSALVYTAVTAGNAGNAITIEHVVDGDETPLSVDVTETAIVVNLETDAEGLPISTATEVADAVALEADAAALVTATVVDGEGDTVVGAMDETALRGGFDASALEVIKAMAVALAALIDPDLGLKVQAVLDVGDIVIENVTEASAADILIASEATQAAAEATAAAVAPGTAPWFDDVTIEDTDPVVVDFDGATATYCEIENTGASDLTLTGYNDSTRTLEPGDKARMDNVRLTSVTVSAASGAGEFSVDATVIPPAEGS